MLKIDAIDVDAAIDQVKQLLETEKNLSPVLKSALEIMLVLVSVLLNRVTLNSKNSSKPPSSDPNRLKPTRKKSGKKPGGQKGHVGTTLKQIKAPDEIEVIDVDRRTLPKGHAYKEVGFEKRQVFDLYVSSVVTEYQAQILEDENGQGFVATFPEGVTQAVQYGNRLKAHAVYMSQYQLLPYKRIEEYFTEQLQIPISQGSIFNFNKEAKAQLTEFEEVTKNKLASAQRMNVDETHINIKGDRHWLHCASNDVWTYYFPHKKRGCEAMDEMNIIPRFTGILCHDHWKPYYTYEDCLHSLCNAHHLRELTRAHEQDDQQWAQKMKTLLEAFNVAVNESGGLLDQRTADDHRKQYRVLLEEADIECPPPDESQPNRKRGRLKRSKSRNLLERLRDYEDDVLRFMGNIDAPFTNNQGERDIRMTKVQQKISGCFRSREGAEIFCRVRGYLSTCRKNGVSSSCAMEMLFEKKLPDFIGLLDR